MGSRKREIQVPWVGNIFDEVLDIPDESDADITHEDAVEYVKEIDEAAMGELVLAWAESESNPREALTRLGAAVSAAVSKRVG